MTRMFILALAAASLSACASKPAPPPPGPSAIVARTADSDVLYRYAGELRREEGCAAATPAYRVVAAFGYGYEIALNDLADCLLALDGSDAERALYRVEAMSALRRASYANVAKAQERLAAELAKSPEGKAEALGWALIYNDHGSHKTFDMTTFSGAFLEDLVAAIGPDAARNAEAFAKSFTPIRPAGFEPPQTARGSAQRASGGRPPQGGQRPRRR